MVLVFNKGGKGRNAAASAEAVYDVYGAAAAPAYKNGTPSGIALITRQAAAANDSTPPPSRLTPDNKKLLESLGYRV